MFHIHLIIYSKSNRERLYYNRFRVLNCSPGGLSILLGPNKRQKLRWERDNDLPGGKVQCILKFTLKSFMSHKAWRWSLKVVSSHNL